MFMSRFLSVTEKKKLFIEKFLEALDLSKRDLPKLLIDGCCCNTAGLVYLDMKS